jgi:osmotically-inducible protein OsmY
LAFAVLIFLVAVPLFAVKNLRGVVGITNNIVVKPQVTPTEIKAKIEEALRRSAELDARRFTGSNTLVRF